MATYSLDSYANGHPVMHGRSLRIACVYTRDPRPGIEAMSMSGLRLFRMAEALARRGHQVDIVIDLHPEPSLLTQRLRAVPFRRVQWNDYDIVKTVFYGGWESLVATSGGNHPFIVSKLGSVVGRRHTEGVYFPGEIREKLFQAQEQVARRSRIVTVLTNRNAALWLAEHGQATQLHIVPTGVDAEIPPARRNPYADLRIDQPVALFAGNIYTRDQQPELNVLWQDRLNWLGRALRRRGVQLVAIGNGQTDLLDRQAVFHFGPIEATEIWDWQRFARVGIVIAQGAVQDNESSKIYYYLRTGLPVVCEAPIPNSWLIKSTGLGIVVSYGDDQSFLDAVTELSEKPPKNEGVEEYMIKNHSWDVRAATYDSAFAAAAKRI